MLAIDAEFTTAWIATLWQCEISQARDTLNLLVNSALLAIAEQVGEAAMLPVERVDHWRQHSLLNLYALALLKRQGKHEASAAAHARYFADAMRRAETKQRYHELLPALPQLRHAVAWAVANDLRRI